MQPIQSSERDIVQLVSNDPDLSTLVVALKAANLIATLSGAGADGFTVFAPTNKAFSLLPETTLAHLLDPANILELQAVLEYHVLPYVYDSRTRITPIFAYTLEGSNLTITKRGGQLNVNNAVAIFVDLEASNGVVHVIDHVLMPPAKPKPTIIERITSMPELSDFQFAYVTALEGSLGSTGILDVDGPLTVFIPTNEALLKLPKGLLDHLLDPKNVKELQEIIQTHIQSNAVLRAGCKKIGRPCNDIFSGTISDLEANQGINELEVTQGITGDVVVDKSRLVPFRPSAYDGSGGLDYFATNGIWHVIDQVLMPDFSPYFPPVPPTGLVSAL